MLVAHQVDVVRYDYNRILEVRPKGINKGVTTKAIIHRLGKQMAEEIQQHIIKVCWLSFLLLVDYFIYITHLNHSHHVCMCYEIQTPFFVMCVGDDRSDEEMFQVFWVHDDCSYTDN